MDGVKNCDKICITIDSLIQITYFTYSDANAVYRYSLLPTGVWPMAMFRKTNIVAHYRHPITLDEPSSSGDTYTEHSGILRIYLTVSINSPKPLTSIFEYIPAVGAAAPVGVGLVATLWLMELAAELNADWKALD
jgi:hypothetical protein